ncbi:hypothetical protein IU479_35730 [Nocardia abscessus]|uniref:ribonucleotide reductase N-terminal alpha domain-containing protein n=1 Tax=Nocardia TaxID=1817 RepID=UPI001894948E|nr:MULTISPECIES: ribonucleotide reductase N-terminal alpha domain-containing protein [Nocardia]MBF6223418.1 hypothetical protein [Nocardia abscessus]MDE1675365.1 ribonucleotide reductase N-terminal alpha domain-containing protein [Nocardia gipuzkoensis]
MRHREFSERIADSVDEPELSPTALAVLAERYLRLTGGVRESPGQMFDRVAQHVARVEERCHLGRSKQWADRFSA